MYISPTPPFPVKRLKALVDLSREHAAFHDPLMCSWVTSCETVPVPIFHVLFPSPPHPPVTLCDLLLPSSIRFPLFTSLHAFSVALIQGAQPEDGVPGRLDHAAGSHRVSLHPLPWSPWRTFNSKVTTLYFPTAEFHICIFALVFWSSFWSCQLLRFTWVYPKSSYSWAFVSVGGVLFSPVPSLLPSVCESPGTSQAFSPVSSFACFHKITLLHCSPHTAPVCLLYSVWWVLSWDKIVQWFSITHLCLHFFFSLKLSNVGKIKLRVYACECARHRYKANDHTLNTQVHFLTASNSITTPSFQSSAGTFLHKRARGWRGWSGLELNKNLCS